LKSYEVKVVNMEVKQCKSGTQTLHRWSWKWWLWHYNAFNVKSSLWLKRLWCKQSHIL